MGDIHRIGGSAVENLRSKPAEAAMDPPGISVLKCPTAQDAADQMRATFPKAAGLHQAGRTVGTTTEELIRDAGFDIIANPTNRLPNQYRIIHPDGASASPTRTLPDYRTFSRIPRDIEPCRTDLFL